MGRALIAAPCCGFLFYFYFIFLLFYIFCFFFFFFFIRNVTGTSKGLDIGSQAGPSLLHLSVVRGCPKESSAPCCWDVCVCCQEVYAAGMRMLQDHIRCCQHVPAGLDPATVGAGPRGASCTVVDEYCGATDVWSRCLSLVLPPSHPLYIKTSHSCWTVPQ